MRLVLLCLVLALLAGCGGSDSRPSPLAQRANAICKTYADTVHALRAPTTMAETTVYAAAAHAAFSKSVRRLHALTPPAGDASTYRAWLALVDDALARVAALERAARAQDQQAINRLGDETKTARVRGDALARRLGFTECANDQ